MEISTFIESMDCFESITKNKYEITIAKKNKIKTLIAVFSLAHFHHIFGLQKLIDIPSINSARATAYRNIKTGKIKYKNICCSAYIDEIEDRILSVKHIKELLIDSEIVINFDKRKAYSIIDAEYIFYKNINGDIINLFMKIGSVKNDIEEIVPVSLLKESTNKFQNNQEKWKVLNAKEID